ncbi:hypothetical protein JK636_18675 [Clostridium sp. YIM B02515]|uniref:Uncharacterized protein n=1 Tax=Clostridium rhizosphaerae TaxID=2803861 RepID=A0ABS1TIF1_9CLOT|nr:hypothetical protein [Clostridium rhizosphaerae]MBL4937733.1 hypothetical protein [Clostridium rhizosphaerae]
MKIIGIIGIIFDKVATSTVAAIIKEWIFKIFKKEKTPEPKAPASNPNKSLIEHKSNQREVKIGSLTISISTSSFTFRSL